MSRLLRSLLGLAAVGLVAGCVGLWVFAQRVAALEPPHTVPAADGIVVLTGDEERISTGMRLMLDGRGRRLLISGVHPTTRMPTELRRLVRKSEPWSETIAKCCIDIGHDALNTAGNATEASVWAQSNAFRSLIIVTSSYHMPRSLVEFHRTMPGVELVPHPVLPGRNLHMQQWWAHPPSVRLMAGEYVKFLGAVTRRAVERVVRGAEPPPVPSRQPPTSVSARTSP